MKKKVLIIGIISLILFTKGISVNADTAPNDYEHDNYSYSIEGFKLRIYEFTYQEKQKNMDEESWDKFIHNDYVKEISIPKEEITFTPTYHEETIMDNTVTMINLDTLIFKENLDLLLEEEINSLEEGKDIYVELLVNYKMKTAPAIYHSFFSRNVFKEIYKDYENGVDLEEIGKDSISLEEENSQIINAFFIDKEDGVLYTKDVNEVDVEDLFTILIFSKEGLEDEKQEELEESAISYQSVGIEEEEEEKIVMFTNISDTKRLAERFTARYKAVSATEENPDTGVQTVNVEDTAVNSSLSKIAGVILVIIGSIFMVQINKKDIKNSK